jgi:hypothetical protein
MARTTGLVTTACAVAWAKHELFTEGIHPPEDLPSEVIHSVIESMRQEGVTIHHQVPRDLPAWDEADSIQRGLLFL